MVPELRGGYLASGGRPPYFSPPKFEKVPRWWKSLDGAPKSRLQTLSGLGLLLIGLITLSWLVVAPAQAQVLNGLVRSVSYLPTCSISGLSTQPLDPNFMTDPDLNPSGATTPCELMGGELTSIVVVRAKVLPLRVSGGETMVFTLNALPPPLSEFQDSSNSLLQPFNPDVPDPICQSQEVGSDCTYLDNQLAITFASSDLAAVYMLERDAAPFPYAYYWFQCRAQLTSPSGPQNARTTWSVPMQCSNMAQTYETKPENAAEFEQCMKQPMPNSGQILQSGLHDVCPSSFVVTNGFRGSTEIYPAPNKQSASNNCAALLCPTNSTDNTLYDVGVIKDAGPPCWLWRTNPQPRALLNVELIARQGNSATTSTIFLSSFQNGALQVGGPANSPILANEISVELASATIADDLSIGVVTCDTCPDDGFGTSRQCKYGMVSDYSATAEIPTDPAQLFLQMGTNPWRQKLAQLMGLTASGDIDTTSSCAGVVCTVPTRACRQCLLNDATVRSFWMTINQQMLDAQWTGGCGANGIAQDVTATRPDIANFMCASGMNGACIPGYQQSTQGLRNGAVTPCEIMYSWAQALADQATSVDSVSYGLGMPADFNPEDPQYRMLGPYLIRDAKYGTGDESGMDIVIYLSAAYRGTVTSVAKGEFAQAGAECSVVSESATTGVVGYAVSNTGASTGTYCVEATFFIPVDDKSQQYKVTNITTPPCFEVPAGMTIEGPVIEGWKYDGPQGRDLIIQLTLRVGAALTRYPQGVTLAVQNVTCNALTPSEIVQVFSGADITNIIQNKYRPNPDDWACNWYGPNLNDVDFYYYCEWYNIFECYQGKTWMWCFEAFIGRGVIVGIIVSIMLVALFSVMACIFLSMAECRRTSLKHLEQQLNTEQREQYSKKSGDVDSSYQDSYHKAEEERQQKEAEERAKRISQLKMLAGIPSFV